MTTYGSVAGVQALVPAVTPLSTTTVPTASQVATWQQEGYAKINRAIGNAGYITPVDAAAALYPELTGLENLYAAAYALRAVSIDTASGDSEDRSEVWLKDFYGQLRDLANSNLALGGATLLASTTANRRRRIRTLQMRKVDGFSRYAPGILLGGGMFYFTPPLYNGGEYTYPNTPSE